MLMLPQRKIPSTGRVRVLVKGVVEMLVKLIIPYEPSLPLVNAPLVTGIAAKLPSSKAVIFALLFFMHLLFIGLVVVLWIIWKCLS